MKIIEWNCQGAFRKKSERILALKPDILIVTECENEKKLDFGNQIPKPTDFFWYSDDAKKGIGIFSFSDYKFELLKEFNSRFRYVIPLLVSNKNDSFLLFAIWAKDNKQNPEARYIAQVWLSLNYYARLLNKSSIFIGDFNSNKIWDDKARLGNHTDVVEILKSHDIHSLYHEQNKVAQGLEKDFTFFMYRKPERPYHIDYCFASKDFLVDGFKIELGLPEDWLELSDHVPIIIETNRKKNHIEFKNSLADFIVGASNKLHSITKEKFTTTIDKLKSAAEILDIDKISLEQKNAKQLIIETMESLFIIDKNLRHIIKKGY